MSDCANLLVIPECDAHQAIAAAVAAGVRAEPQFAAAKVIDSLAASFGPIIQKIVALIQSGIKSLPAILAALQAAGITVPPWVNVVIVILLAVTQQTT